MMHIPSDPRPAQVEAQLKVMELEQKRNYNLSWEDSSSIPQSKRLSRGAYVLMQLTVILLIIIGVIVLYHFIL